MIVTSQPIFDAAALVSTEKKYTSSCIYLDNAATSPLDPGVLEVMQSILSKAVIGNAHSKHHPYGAASSMLIQKSREQVASSIDARTEEIVFTSGATESNNTVIKGLADSLKKIGKTRILTSAVEHKSVLQSLAYLAEQGFQIEVLPVKSCGMLTADVVEEALDDTTGLVCIQAVNNETGTIQPIRNIAKILKQRDILLHCDAAQALGKVPFSVKDGVDFASFSAHKVYGPQGIGALYVNADRRSLLKPLQEGGGQEHGLRSGTLPVALCAGFGKACSLIEDDREHLQGLRQSFLSRIASLKPVVYGHWELRANVPGILNLRFPGIDNDTLIVSLPGLALGTGSACSSSGTSLSHVIKAITGDDQAARECIRISFGRFTTPEEMAQAAEEMIIAVSAIRKLQED